MGPLDLLRVSVIVNFVINYFVKVTIVYGNDFIDNIQPLSEASFGSRILVAHFS